MKHKTSKRLLSESLEMLRAMRPLAGLNVFGYSDSFAALDALIDKLEVHAPFNTDCPMCRMEIELEESRKDTDYWRGKAPYRPTFFD